MLIVSLRMRLRGTYAQEDLSEDDIVLILEVDGVNDSNAILALGGDESALLTTVRDVQDLRGNLASVDLREDVLEGLSIDVTLEESKAESELV